MKKIALIALSLVIPGTFAAAQQPPRARRRLRSRQRERREADPRVDRWRRLPQNPYNCEDVANPAARRPARCGSRK